MSNDGHKNNGQKNEGESPYMQITPFPIFDPAEFAKISNRNLQMATRAASACYNGATKLNQEMMNFVNSRIKKDIETAQEYMTAKSSEQAFHCQAEFVECALRDYADEASKMLHLAADMARQTLTPVEERTEEVLHNIEARAAQQSRGKQADQQKAAE